MRSSNFTMCLLNCLLLFLLYSCEVEKIEPANPSNEIEESAAKTNDSTSNKKDNEPSKNNESAKDIITIGEGSGSIKLDGIDGKKYKIKSGIYSNIHLENIKNTSIEGLGNVKVNNGNIFISNVNGLTISGISIENYGESAIYVTNSANNLTLKDIKLKNIANWAIRFKIDKKYDGTSKSFSENIHLINIQAENIGSLFVSDGGIQNDGFYGLIKGFKLINSSIINSPNLTNGIYLNLGENYEISNNIVKNVNSNSNNHNGIFHLKGNGKFFGNKITDHQGNGVRAWLFSITKSNALVEIYNNIVYNSTRYSAFEVQVTPEIENFNSFKSADAKVYNNTVGRMNTGEPKYYEGRVIDIYSTHGKVEVYNNLYFDMRDKITSFNQASPGTDVIERNNHYFKKASDAVTDLIKFKSKVPNIGANQ